MTKNRNRAKHLRRTRTEIDGNRGSGSTVKVLRVLAFAIFVFFISATPLVYDGRTAFNHAIEDLGNSLDHLFAVLRETIENKGDLERFCRKWGKSGKSSISIAMDNGSPDIHDGRTDSSASDMAEVHLFLERIHMESDERMGRIETDVSNVKRSLQQTTRSTDSTSSRLQDLEDVVASNQAHLENVFNDMRCQLSSVQQDIASSDAKLQYLERIGKIESSVLDFHDVMAKSLDHHREILECGSILYQKLSQEVADTRVEIGDMVAGLGQHISTFQESTVNELTALQDTINQWPNPYHLRRQPTHHDNATLETELGLHTNLGWGSNVTSRAHTDIFAEFELNLSQDSDRSPTTTSVVDGPSQPPSGTAKSATFALGFGMWSTLFEFCKSMVLLPVVMVCKLPLGPCGGGIASDGRDHFHCEVINADPRTGSEFPSEIALVSNEDSGGGSGNRDIDQAWGALLLIGRILLLLLRQNVLYETSISQFDVNHHPKARNGRDVKLGIWDMRRVVRGCCGALGPIFVGRNQEGRYGARTAFDFASGLLEVAVSVLGGFASRGSEGVDNGGGMGPEVRGLCSMVDGWMDGWMEGIAGSCMECGLVSPMSRLLIIRGDVFDGRRRRIHCGQYESEVLLREILKTFVSPVEESDNLLEPGGYPSLRDSELSPASTPAMTQRTANKQTCPPRYKEPEAHYQGGEKQFA
ncbi:hypothetical protein C8R48DRAFT_812849 [Suillus tomentosus]|nr:hypothetical protein C8R48DRAFT_812849 [Suillus tomentosus]